MTQPSPDPDDLTARARIRDAAMRHFGEYGFERATIRGIAETAGVSLGLVRHHFGSKQALREACDAHLAQVIHRLSDQVRAGAEPEGGSYVAAARIAGAAYQAYLARALVEGGAAPVFDEMVELGTRWHTDLDQARTDQPSASPRVRAAVHTAMALSLTVLHEHVSRAIGVDVQSPEGDDLVARALIDLYSRPLLSKDDAKKALDAIERHEKP
ncbi:DNA-binding transcriptional regulator, AcrR family [Actinopolymorpha cephalotaxi]|uniref:AcrR family transcriptional regulator n=1 Tax=Actinopolymorpha cephalotaxi TaxID=504797 RepID=A0A1I3B1H1_9ACTN|nr:TetR/AcrR family transcriptional regulator [Actinopolymorpha cephalotaxi]NYH84250.1 AcrR family transcriptional regulator [Actinopolymorpha cephalotaxi]SFH55956.1 DNA-binding transcriptional regulator, AcrR family [Actinopolymorpha cephalotaxi]